MITIVNFIVLLVSSVLFSVLYMVSVSPARLEKRWGEKAYRRCGTIRLISMLVEIVTTACLIVYFYYPLPISLSQTFPWARWISLIIAGVIGIPSLGIMFVGMRDAGEEAAIPKKEHTLYRGIYEKIRHPQALGEVFLWEVIAFILHSPFLALYSLIWFPIFYLFCLFEERDLVLRYGQSYVDYQKKTGMFLPKKNKRAS